MPEVIHDLNLRNVAGQVCYCFATGCMAVPVPPHYQGQVLVLAYQDVDGTPFEALHKRNLVGRKYFSSCSALFSHAGLTEFQQRIQEDILARETTYKHPLMQQVAGAVKVAVDVSTLPHPPVFSSAWCHLPFDWLWVDHVDKKGVYSMLFDGRPPPKPYAENYDHVAIGWLFEGIAGSKRHRGMRHILEMAGPLMILKNEGGLDYHIPAHIELHGLSANRVLDMVEALLRIVFVLNVVNNVSLMKVAPASKVPKYERKYPRLEYHVLKIHSNRNGTISPSLKEQLRQSPRQHLRRGHLRRFNNPRFTKPYTWIPPCIVGDAGRGTIVKDYLL